MNKDELVAKIEEATLVVNEAKRQYYLSHFYEFNRDILGWPDIYEPLHRKLCDFVQHNVRKKKLLILMPRSSFKSSIVTIGYTLWRIAQNPNERILIANATYPMAVQFLSQIKDHLIKNEKFVELFGNLATDADSWRENMFSVSREKSYEKKEPTAVAFGMGSNLVGSHYSLAILDDMVNDQNIGTRDQIDKVIDFYKNTLDLVDPHPDTHNKEIIVIGTTWDFSDLYSWIQDPDTGILQDFEMMKLPAYKGKWGNGELLFPTRLTWEVLAELKRQQGTSHFASQYLLDPVPLEDATFKFKFKYYEETDVRGLTLNNFITIDPAISESMGADFSAMICVGVDKENTWYIRDIWRDRVQPKRLLDQMFYWDDKWKPITIGIETTAFQKVLQYFAYEEMKKRNHTLRLTELKHTRQTKEQRIMGLEPRYETGSVLHCKAVPHTDDLEDELRRFPKSKNDDLIDALASQLELAYPTKKQERREKKYRRGFYTA